MADYKIYEDIALRTKGDIYIGVVGPVRTGKSTLIQRFMQEVVLPNITDPARRERATDELPQSGAGRTIMTTEPKFVPEEAVGLSLGQKVECRVRMIDCVGYLVPSALGYMEAEQPRMVKTPWFPEEIPFNMAAELGTDKVIEEHSTVGLVVTSDGSIGEIPRAEYAQAEKRVIEALQELRKPFVVVLNSTHPTAPETVSLAEKLSKEYGVSVVPVDCLRLGKEEIELLLQQLLTEFPLQEVSVELPLWVTALPQSHWLRKTLYGDILAAFSDVKRICEFPDSLAQLAGEEYLADIKLQKLSYGSGTARAKATLDPTLFYRVLGESTGIPIQNDADLLETLLELSRVKTEYERYQKALEQVEETGYGIVIPTTEQLTLEPPEILRQGGRYGVRLKASAPSIHMIRADIHTEVAPIVGSERQSEELVAYLLSEFEQAPEKIWESNIFGKSLHELVNEGLHNKLARMPEDARAKLGETIARMINEGCSGLICIIL